MVRPLVQIGWDGDQPFVEFGGIRIKLQETYGKMADEQITFVDESDEMPSGVSSNFLTTEVKEMLVESGQTIWITDTVEADSRFGPMVTYTIEDANGEESKLSQSLKDNRARRNQMMWFRKRLVNDGDKVAVRLVKKGRAYDFDKPLDGTPF